MCITQNWLYKLNCAYVYVLCQNQKTLLSIRWQWKFLFVSKVFAFRLCVCLVCYFLHGCVYRSGVPRWYAVPFLCVVLWAILSGSFKHRDVSL